MGFPVATFYVGGRMDVKERKEEAGQPTTKWNAFCMTKFRKEKSTAKKRSGLQR